MVSFLGEVAVRGPPASITACTWLPAVLREGAGHAEEAQPRGGGSCPGSARCSGEGRAQVSGGGTSIRARVRGRADPPERGSGPPRRVLLTPQAGTHLQFVWEKADPGRKLPPPGCGQTPGPDGALCAAPPRPPALPFITQSCQVQRGLRAVLLPSETPVWGN